MLDFNAWVSKGVTAIDPTSRAVAAWNRIQEKPTAIRIRRNTTVLDEQTVRIEFNSGVLGNEEKGAAGASGRQMVLVFGIAGHPTEPDTNIQRDDRFAIGNLQFRCMTVVTTTGEIQALCEVQS